MPPAGQAAQGVFQDLIAVRTLSPEGGAFEILEVLDGVGRRFALKRIATLGVVGEDLILRLQHEGDVLGVTSGCPHVIRLVSRSNLGRPVLLLELADGGDLAALLANSGGQLPSAEVRRLGLQLCTALAAIHERGIVHRDVKPSNLLLFQGDLRLADFGVATIGHPPRALPEEWVEDPVGTEPYAAPEQRDPSAMVTSASDVYGAGATVARLLTSGTVGGTSAPAWLQPALHAAPASRPTVAELGSLIRRNL